jgi:hypothetical protein
MAWVDCMRWRRVASVIRAFGWVASGLIISGGAAATFVLDSGGLSVFALSVASCLIVLGIAHAIGWVADRRGDRLVKR